MKLQLSFVIQYTYSLLVMSNTENIPLHNALCIQTTKGIITINKNVISIRHSNSKTIAHYPISAVTVRY